MALVISKSRKVAQPKPSIVIEVQKANPYKDPTTGRFTTGGGGGVVDGAQPTLSIEDDLKNFDPTAPVPASPKNAGGVDAKTWDNWEHGPDGNQYVELYRQYAGEQLGLEVPKSPMDVGGSEHYLTTRGFGGSSTDTARKQSTNMVNAIANGTPNQPALYRGLVATEYDANSAGLVEQITSLQPGDTLDMPLVSTTRSLGAAAWYAADRQVRQTTSPVIMKIQEGARGVSVPSKISSFPQDYEVVTSGKFEVVGITKVEAPYWSRDTLQTRAWNMGTPDEHLEVLDSNGYLEPTRARQVYDAVSTGNWKSLETDNYKLTDDRPKVTGLGGDSKILSSWTKKEPKTFTIVEVKMVQPHIIQKVKSYGVTFDKLFNVRPFINDNPIEKANPYKDPTTGRFTTGGGGAATTTDGAVKVVILDEERLDEIDKEISATYKERYALEQKYDSQSPRWSDKYSAEDKKKYEELRKKEDALYAERAAVQQEYFDAGLEMKSGNSAFGEDLGFEDDRFHEIRDEYVVPDELTLKTNAGLRRTGRVTTKVQRFDEMVEQGTVVSPMRVHRAAVLSPEQVSKLEVGTSFIDRGFQSTATTEDGAQMYLDIRAGKIEGSKVLFQYDLQPGIHAVNVSYGEVVVQRSAKVSVTGLFKRGDTTIVKAEVSKSE